MRDPIVPTTSPRASLTGNGEKTKKLCMKFAYEDIKEVHKRRYLLQVGLLYTFNYLTIINNVTCF